MGKSYVPNGKCEEFIRMVGSGEVFTSLFAAANGVGKSCVGANIVSNICFGPLNEYFDYPLFRNFPYLKKGRIISDPTTLKEKIIPELKKWFPSNRYTEHYNTTHAGKNYESKWVTDTGFEFDLMSNEQAPKEFESTDLGWIWFDEPSKKSIYMASVARTRRGGVIFFTLTPLFYSAWIKTLLYDKRDGKNVDYVTADVEANCIEHGVRGILRHQDIERMIAQYPDNEKSARVKGEFGHLLGLVHKGFDTKVHVVEPFDTGDPSKWTHYMALDTHPRVPDATLWMAVNEKNQCFIVRELGFTGTAVEYAEKVKVIERNMNVRGRLIDPSAFNEDKRSLEPSYVTRLSNNGLYFIPGSKRLIDCIRRTDDAFAYQQKGGVLIVPPEVFIFSSCVNLIEELNNYVWNEYKGIGVDEKDPMPKPKDINDHYVENLHRLLYMDTFVFRVPQKKGKKKFCYSKKYSPRKPGGRSVFNNKSY